MIVHQSIWEQVKNMDWDSCKITHFLLSIANSSDTQEYENYNKLPTRIKKTKNLHRNMVRQPGQEILAIWRTAKVKATLHLH